VSKRKSDISVDLGNSPNVREFLDAHSQPLTDMDLVELEQQHTYDEKNEITSEGDGRISKESTVQLHAVEL
jgi:hypothetical protein